MSKAWSHSALKEFELCPLKYHANKVAKMYPFVESEQMIYGKEVHKVAEKFLRDGVDLPEQYEQFRKVLTRFANMPGEKHCEEKWALTGKLKPTKYFAKDVWVRALADLVIIDGDKAKVVDWKTGSAKYPDLSQLELLSLFIFILHPNVVQVRGALVFLLHDTMLIDTFERKDMEKLWKKWKNKTKLLDAAFESDIWAPKPNALCKNWCNVEHCEYNGG